MSDSSFNFADWYAVNKGRRDCLADNALEAIDPDVDEDANVAHYVECQQLRSEAVVIVLAVITVLVILFFLGAGYLNEEPGGMTTGIAGAVVTGLVGGGLCLFIYFSTEARATTEMTDIYYGIKQNMKQTGKPFKDAYTDYVDLQYKKQDLKTQRERNRIMANNWASRLS